MDKKLISIDDFQRFLSKVILKNEPLLSQDEIKNIIKKYASDLGLIFVNDSIPISTLLDKAKSGKSSKEYINESIISLFSFDNENMIKILSNCMLKLHEYKETSLANQLDWVILLLSKDNFKIEVDVNDTDAVSFMKEYSCDLLAQSKEKDLKIARTLSNARDKMHKRGSCFVAEPTVIREESDFKRMSKKSKTVRVKIDEHLSHKNVVAFKENELTKLILHDNESSDDNAELEFEDNVSINCADKDKIKEKDIEDDKVTYGKRSVNNSALGLPIVKLENQKELIFDQSIFNIFQYSQSKGRENVLYTMSNDILDKYNFFTFINVKRYHSFIDKIRVGYDNFVPYHNDLHAADVLQTCHFIINNNTLRKDVDLTSLDICGLFLAAIVHDFKHPGLNNSYHINKRTSIAIRYNDSSVLEHYHISSAFKVLSHPNSNILIALTLEEYRVIRKRMVECVLGTDMAKHAKSVITLKKKLEYLNQLKESTGSSLCELLVNYIPEDSKFDKQQELLTFIIHCADISNPAKIFSICKEWTLLLMDEFFLQGDKEKAEGLPISFLCDRDNTHIPKSQIAFISNIILPCMTTLAMIFPHCGILVSNAKNNIKSWEIESEKSKENDEEQKS